MVIEIDKQELEGLLETIRQQAEQIEKLEEEVQRLKELLERKADAKSAKKPRYTEDYSFDRHKRKKATRRLGRNRRGEEPTKQNGN